MRGLKESLTRGAIWLAATRILVNLTAFATTLLLARLLVPADFGLVAMATTVTAIIISITELSVVSALVQHKDPQDRHYDSAFTLNLARSALIAAVIALLAVPVSHQYGDDRLAGIMLATAAVTVVGGATNPKLAVFSRALVFWQEFVLGVSQKLVAAIASILIAIVWQSYWALVVGNAAAQLAALVLSYALFPYLPRLRIRECRELLSFSAWLSLGQAVNTLNWKSDHLAIGAFLGSTPLGFYALGDSLAILPTREATTPLAQTLFPGFARLTDDKARLRQAYQRAQAFLCAVALPVGCGFAFIARPLILLTMGEKWEPVIVIIQLLASVFALQTLASTLQPLAMALGDTRGLFKRDLLNLAIRMPLIGLGLVFGGLVGIVYARCVSGLASTVINMLMVRRLLDLTLKAQLAVNARSLASVAAMVIGMTAIGRALGDDRAPALLASRIAVLVLAGAAIYGGMLYGLWRTGGRPAGPERELAELVAKFLPFARA